jgi:hypothetical protein
MPSRSPDRAPRASRALHVVSRSTARVVIAGTVAGTVVGIVTATASAAGAQGAPPVHRGVFEVRPFAGAYIPTGDQRDLLRDAFHVGAQASYRVVPSFAVVGTFAWSPTKDRIARGDQALDVLHYDVGVEGRAASWLRGGSWEFTPFAGLGVGGRTYRYRDLDVDAQSRVAGYGALGGELGLGRLGVRIEARDYLSRFTPTSGRGDSDTRNDVTVAAGLTVRF